MKSVEDLGAGKRLWKVPLRNMAASLMEFLYRQGASERRKNGYRLIMSPTETTNEDTRMRGSTRIDAGAEEENGQKLYREKMQTREVVGEVTSSEAC